MQRRLKAYRIANNSTVAEPSVQDFFASQGAISILNVGALQTSEVNALNTMKIYIERVRILN